MSWDIGQAIKRMMRGGEKSRLNCARQRDFRPSTYTQRRVTTLQAIDRASVASRRGFLTLLVSLAVLVSVGVALAQIPTVPTAPPPPPGQNTSGQDSKIRVDVNLV